ncbi:hypothetical protein BCR35DRAFT_332789 [Leucosporidium creatinivorum]|uniref:Uncharacterized protein n=1 Tax=Leucosporidium creatinivorum TaxID=106004 RepID=A0A1Y2EY51_9BASI|nr:hypothetical protein BCR35DRAFT_332789 [Leucosporidium creatinivorum]
MADRMSPVLSSSSASPSQDMTTLQPSSTSTPSRLSKREATPPPEFLERSKRSRKLSERAIAAAGQGSSSEEEEENAADDGEEEEYQDAREQEAVASSSLIGQLGAQKGGRTTGRGRGEGAQIPVKRFYGSTTSSDGTSNLPSPFLPLHLPVSSPPQSFAWDPSLGQLIPITPRNQSLALETLSFPSTSYLGFISPADAEQSNEFIKAQSCVEACSHSLWWGKRPGRIRKHFVECKRRKEEFEKRGERDVLARLCELQLEAQQLQKLGVELGGSSDPPSPRRPPTPRTSRTSKTAGQEKPPPPPQLSAPTFPSFAPAPPRPIKPKEDLPLSDAELMPPPPVPSRLPTTPRAPKRRATWIEASTGRMIKTRATVVEPESTLRVLIYSNPSLSPTLHLHPPAFNSLTPLPPPRLLRPSAISHSSSTNGSVLSAYSYSIPSAQVSKGAGISIEFGEEDGEVHVEREVRGWLSERGAKVVLRVKGEEAEWLRVER